MPTPFSLQYPAVPTPLDGAMAGLTRGFQTADVLAQNDRARRDSDLENEMLQFKQKQALADESSGLLNAERESKMATANENISLSPKRTEFLKTQMDTKTQADQLELVSKKIASKVEEAGFVSALAAAGEFGDPNAPAPSLKVQAMLQEKGIKMPDNPADLTKWIAAQNKFYEASPMIKEKLREQQLHLARIDRQGEWSVKAAEKNSEGRREGPPPDPKRAFYQLLEDTDVVSPAMVQKLRAFEEEAISSNPLVKSEITGKVASQIETLRKADSEVFVKEIRALIPEETKGMKDSEIKDNNKRDSLINKAFGKVWDTEVDKKVEQAVQRRLAGKQVIGSAGGNAPVGGQDTGGPAEPTKKKATARTADDYLKMGSGLTSTDPKSITQEYFGMLLKDNYGEDPARIMAIAERLANKHLQTKLKAKIPTTPSIDMGPVGPGSGG